MREQLQKLTIKMEVMKEQQKVAKKELTILTQKKRKLQKEIKQTQAIQIIIQEIAQQTQNHFQKHLSFILDGSLKAVLGRKKYKTKVEFVKRRGKTEIDFKLDLGNGELTNLIDQVGGGVVDILSVTLQATLLCFQVPSPQMILFLDEPFKHLKGSDYPQKGIEVLKDLSSQMGIQIIAISHDIELMEAADQIICMERI